ncbi:ArnT family glycosyltransferase [Fimbriimonas ginsengisoli]|uniref:Glycosyl transferase family 39 n=1 Tax=Fimbriimonas ginsengisoli Gsoil 348 TaxID=661478 RepID=A0A068NVB2_FIMGI|nr:glycosyltransferase family 39 protein [Fimbriimonas ginsengisoli]AIE86710.1 glycosyl transferase family 39 [Fimbriimonas ginsengisoli Gsoil 348]
MLGVLITLAVVAGCAGVGAALVRRWSEALDTALRLGIGGLVGLGVLGTATLFIGLIPGGFSFGIYLVGAYALAGIFLLARGGRELRFGLPKGPAVLGPLAMAVLVLFTLVAVLAPSDGNDWDSLAYHLAVPKLWLAAGHIYSVPAIHHSNFPDVIDDLYTWGLMWGGQAGAKGFSLGFLVLGILATFGFARQRYGGTAGWWSALAFATVPAILWESGTAYIDVGHGLFAGLGIAFAAIAVADEDRRSLWLAAVLLGFAAASKYTGLQTILVVCGAVVIFGVTRRQVADSLKSAVLIGLVSVAIASPWLIKNVVNVGNPVYPFLYERFGGANWDQRRADIYRIEQQSFGVGHSPTNMGHAVLGLAYQPGRYVNPNQTHGGGSPFGAAGIAVLAALVIWPLSGRARRFERFILASSGIFFVLWIFLSQQSRYITTLAPPAAILLGGAAVMLTLRQAAMAVAVLQTSYTLWLFQSQKFSDQLQVVLGRVSADEYQAATIPFFEASKAINQQVVGGKVALYDEVFGNLLDVPYMWANPGHSTLIPYDSMNNAEDYVREMKRLGFTHAYINLSPMVKDKAFAQQWLASMGLYGAPTPLQADLRKSLVDDWQSKWEVLLADAVAEHKLIPVQPFKHGVLFKFQ